MPLLELIEQQPLQDMSMRDKILYFEEQMKKLPNVKYGDMDECPLTHKFADGVYVREIFIPARMLIVGKIHKHSHPNFLLKGKITVVTEQEGVQELEAPLSMISEAGTKRIVYTYTDTVWSTVHVTNETDLKKIEEEVIVATYDMLPDNFHKMLDTIEGENL